MVLQIFPCDHKQALLKMLLCIQDLRYIPENPCKLFGPLISKYKPPGGLCLEGRFNGGFFALPVRGAYIWRGLYMEGLIFGILRIRISPIFICCCCCLMNCLFVCHLDIFNSKNCACKKNFQPFTVFFTINS